MKIKGQSIAEYAILIGIVSAAIMGMNVYIKRGVQAGIKQSVDQMANQEDGAAETRLGKKGVADILASQNWNEYNNTNNISQEPGSLTYGRNESSSITAFSHSRTLTTDENE